MIRSRDKNKKYDHIHVYPSARKNESHEVFDTRVLCKWNELFEQQIIPETKMTILAPRAKTCKER